MDRLSCKASGFLAQWIRDGLRREGMGRTRQGLDGTNTANWSEIVANGNNGWQRIEGGLELEMHVCVSMFTIVCVLAVR